MKTMKRGLYRDDAKPDKPGTAVGNFGYRVLRHYNEHHRTKRLGIPFTTGISAQSGIHNPKQGKRSVWTYGVNPCTLRHHLAFLTYLLMAALGKECGQSMAHRRHLLVTSDIK